MEQFGDLPGLLLREGVSLAILMVVLAGLYRLVNRFLDIMGKHLDRCCGELERIADALEGKIL